MANPYDDQWLADLLARGEGHRVISQDRRTPIVEKAPAPRHKTRRSRVFPAGEDAPRDRYRSDAERRYAALLDGEVSAGVWQWWYYEPCKGLYLAPNLSYTPDFLAVPCDRQRRYEFHEVKGEYIYEKDWNKAKMAAALYHAFRFVLAQWKDEQWHWKTIPAY